MQQLSEKPPLHLLAPKDIEGGSFLLRSKMVMVTLLDVELASSGYTVTVRVLIGLSAMASFLMEFRKENCCKTWGVKGGEGMWQ